jgi:hypothetical protein
MHANRLIALVGSILTAMVFVVAAQCAERNYWRHQHGCFQNTAGDKWEEQDGDGNLRHFVEKARTQSYIELRDECRNCCVRLYDDRCDVKFDDGPFEQYYDGKWGN